MTALLQPIRTVRRAFGDDCVVVLECRRCGKTVDDGVERCARCDTRSIARYEIR